MVWYESQAKLKSKLELKNWGWIWHQFSTDWMDASQWSIPISCCSWKCPLKCCPLEIGDPWGTVMGGGRQKSPPSFHQKKFSLYMAHLSNRIHILKVSLWIKQTKFWGHRTDCTTSDLRWAIPFWMQASFQPLHRLNLDWEASCALLQCTQEKDGTYLHRVAEISPCCHCHHGQKPCACANVQDDCSLPSCLHSAHSSTNALEVLYVLLRQKDLS